jgi:uncharacterized protein YbjT (DUF2867 family)
MDASQHGVAHMYRTKAVEGAALLNSGSDHDVLLRPATLSNVTPAFAKKTECIFSRTYDRRYRSIPEIIS